MGARTRVCVYVCATLCVSINARAFLCRGCTCAQLVAAQVVEANGLADRVTVLHADVEATSFQLVRGLFQAWAKGVGRAALVQHDRVCACVSLCLASSALHARVPKKKQPCSTCPGVKLLQQMCLAQLRDTPAR